MSLQNTYNEFNEQGKGLNLKSKLKLRSSSSMIVLLAAFLVSCAIMFYGVSAVNKETKIVKFTNEVKTEDIKSGKLLLSKILKINDKNKEVKSEEIEKIGELIPNRDNYEDYLTHIASLANSKNIKIDSFSISKDKKSKEKEKEEEDRIFNKVNISIEASGGFLNFMSFMRDIENGIPFIYERLVSISKSEASSNKNKEEFEEGGAVEIDSNPILDYKMEMEFYYY